jgi:DNA polymerase-4
MEDYTVLRWIYVDLNSYFATVEQVENPALRGRPVAVVPMMADTTSCLAASYQAKAFGVKTGTSVRDAKRMCPGIVFVKAEHRKYIQYHHRIVDIVESCAHVSKICSIDEMACALIGRERQEDNARTIARSIKQALAQRISPVLTCSIGIAPNRYLSKIASDMQKPDGLTVIKKEDLPGALAHLKLRDLVGIGPRMEERLMRARCRSMGDLLALSPQRLREVWGSIGGEELWYLLRGEELEERETKRSSISHSHVLAPELRTPEGAWATISRLLEKAAVRLREERFYAQELSVFVSYLMGYRSKSAGPYGYVAREERDSGRYFHETVRFFETQDTGLLLQYLGEIWRDAPQKHFLKVGVALGRLRPYTAHQLSLFEDPKREALMSAVDEINEEHKKPLLYYACTKEAQAVVKSPIAFRHIPKV